MDRVEYIQALDFDAKFGGSPYEMSLRRVAYESISFFTGISPNELVDKAVFYIENLYGNKCWVLRFAKSRYWRWASLYESQGLEPQDFEMYARRGLAESIKSFKEGDFKAYATTVIRREIWQQVGNRTEYKKKKRWREKRDRLRKEILKIPNAHSVEDHRILGKALVAWQYYSRLLNEITKSPDDKRVFVAKRLHSNVLTSKEALLIHAILDTQSDGESASWEVIAASTGQTDGVARKMFHVMKDKYFVYEDIASDQTLHQAVRREAEDHQVIEIPHTQDDLQALDDFAIEISAGTKTARVNTADDVDYVEVRIRTDDWRLGSYWREENNVPSPPVYIDQIEDIGNRER